MIQNATNKELLHIENMKDYVEHGKVSATKWSAQWQKKKYGSQIYFVNRWQPGQTIAFDSRTDTLVNQTFTEPNETNLWQNKSI